MPLNGKMLRGRFDFLTTQHKLFHHCLYEMHAFFISTLFFNLASFSILNFLQFCSVTVLQCWRAEVIHKWQTMHL